MEGALTKRRDSTRIWGRDFSPHLHSVRVGRFALVTSLFDK